LRHGVLLCKAEPELPKELIKLFEAERAFLEENRPEGRYVRKGPSVEWKNMESAEVSKEKNRLSAEILRERDKFHEYCRTLVTVQEVKTANQNMVTEFGRLIAEADMMWARPPEQVNISDLHRQACRAMGQERPWSYTAVQLVDCEGCGVKHKEGIAVCPHCGAILDREKAIRLGLLDPESTAGVAVAREAAESQRGRTRKERSSTERA